MRDLNEITEQVIGSALDVHRELGPGLLESAYEACLAWELRTRGLRVERQRTLPLVYRNAQLDAAYRLDMVVAESVLVEVKAVDQALAVPQAQVISYLKLSGLSVGLLINFHSMVLRTRIRRIVNRYDGKRPSSAFSASSAPPR